MLANLKSLREKASVSQKILADAIGVSQQSINKYENHNTEPDIEVLIRIADYFDVSIDYLVGRSDSFHTIYAGTINTSLTAEEMKVLTAYRHLSPAQQHCIAAFLDVSSK